MKEKDKNQINSNKILKLLVSAFGVSFILAIFVSFFSVYGLRETSTRPETNNVVVENISPTRTSTPTPRVNVGTPPAQYRLSGGTHAFQTFNNCGPASLSMTLSFYDIYVTQQVLGDELRPYQIPSGNNDDKSVTLPELAEKAKDYGFVAYHRPGGDIEIMKQFISNDIPVITRTITEIGEDIGHYRVVFGYDENQEVLIQNDSLQGRNLEYDYDHFLTLWRPFGYEYLVLVPEEKVALAEQILGEDADELVAWQNSVAKLEAEVVQNPQDAQLSFALSVAYYNTGEYQKSIDQFESVESRLPFRALWYQIEPLLAYQELGMYNQALTRIDNILNNGNRAYSELYQIRGEIYLDQGRVEAARQEFETALVYNKNFEPAKTSLSNL